jgi:uncharacterized low-complexity protein
MSKNLMQSLSVAVGAALLGSVAVANAGDLFRVNDLGFGYQLTGEDHAEGKCGEGKCGEGKCGEGKCGEKKAEEGKCGGDKADDAAKADAEGKCGEGKCGEGKCGGEKKADEAPKQ